MIEKTSKLIIASCASRNVLQHSQLITPRRTIATTVKNQQQQQKQQDIADPSTDAANSAYPSSSSKTSSQRSNTAALGVGKDEQPLATPSSSVDSSSSTITEKIKENTSSMSTPAPPPKAHSPFAVSVIRILGRVLGYNPIESAATRITSDLYDQCAARAEEQPEFWYDECKLPRTFQSWFHITNLHVHLLLTRFRSLEPRQAQAFSQHLINHFFIDAETRMSMRFGVRTSRLIKGYMKDMHSQQRGALLGLDEAISYSTSKDKNRVAQADSALATALWRNLWGAGEFGHGVGGVKRKLKGVDKYSDEEKAARRLQKGNENEELPDLARDMGFSGRGIQSESSVANSSSSQSKLSPDDPISDLEFLTTLEKLVRWYRFELNRLGKIRDNDIISGRIGGSEALNESSSMQEQLDNLRQNESIAAFSNV